MPTNASQANIKKSSMKKLATAELLSASGVSKQTKTKQTSFVDLRTPSIGKELGLSTKAKILEEAKS